VEREKTVPSYVPVTEVKLPDQGILLGDNLSKGVYHSGIFKGLAHSELVIGYVSRIVVASLLSKYLLSMNAIG
jgi:hypothetical protein